jgi:23S rRNA (pseudouridine1915-N3)-methyltransferase
VRVRVLWFGKSTASPYEGEVETYRRRVSRRWPAEDVALKPARGGRQHDPRRACAEEAARARAHLAAGWQMIALDEGGRRMDSVGFARLIEEIEKTAAPGLGFVVGSDLGLDPELRRESRLSLSLSPLTLPHLLARLLLWEQLFRATHILGGGGYHRQRIQ